MKVAFFSSLKVTFLYSLVHDIFLAKGIGANFISSGYLFNFFVSSVFDFLNNFWTYLATTKLNLYFKLCCCKNDINQNFDIARTLLEYVDQIYCTIIVIILKQTAYVFPQSIKLPHTKVAQSLL